MNVQTILDIGAQAAWISMKIAAPSLVAIMLTGFIVSLFQAATQINEASIAFLAKLIVMAITLAALGSWSIQNLVDYTHRTIGSIADVTR